MARLPRFALSGQPQHVILRGNNRQEIFSVDEDYRFFLEKPAANAVGREDALIKPHELYRRLGRTSVQRQSAYRQLFRPHLGDATLVSIRDATNKAWVLGGEHFKQRIQKQLDRRVEPKSKGGDRKSERYRKQELLINRV